MKHLVITIVILAITAVILLQVDDSLKSTPRNWIESQNLIHKELSDAFVYLNGVMAPEDKDVYEYGKFKLSLTDNNRHIEAEASEKELKLPSDREEIFCPLSEANCLDSILFNQHLWETVVQNNSMLLNRYNEFLVFKEFRTSSKPSLDENIPSYRYITTGNRVFLIKCLLLARRGDPTQALIELSQDLVSLRKQLSLADSTIHKLVFAELISHDLDIISHIATSYNATLTDKITLLPPSERSLELPVIREYTMIYNSFLEMDRHPEIFEEGGDMPGWLVRIFYKPNMTMNTEYEYYHSILKLSLLSSKEFAKKKHLQKNKTPWNYQFRNAVGGALSILHPSPLHALLASLFDLNCKIAITNYLLSGRSNEILNPYYGNNETVHFKTNEICLDGPYPDEKRRRCVKI